MSVITLGTAADHDHPAAGGTDLEAAILDVFQRYEAAWNSQHRDLLVGFWDDSADPVYLAQEQADWITGRSDVAQYFAPALPEFVDALVLRFRIDHVRPLGEHHALAAGWVGHEIESGSEPSGHGDGMRVTAVLHERDSVWRFVSYAEAHPRPTAQ